MHKKPNTTLNKHARLSFRRRMRHWKDRTWLVSKILLMIFLYFLIFTKHPASLKEFLWETLYEYTSIMGANLDTVIIRGNKNLENNEVIECLDADVGTPVLSLDLKKIHSKLEGLKWVDHVSVRRSFPKTMEINIAEKEPIAIWQNDRRLSLIDIDGNIIVSDKIENFVNLLHVVGGNANIHAYSLKEELAKEKGILENVTAAVRFGDRRWNLILRQNITIKMPEKGFAEALQYVAKLNKKGKLFDQNYKMLDLRNAEKYFIEKYRK
jgi:cell division protein FtsQ